METTLERRLTKESKWIFEKYRNIAMEYNNENPDYTLHLSTTIKGKKLLKKAHDKGSKTAELIYCSSLTEDQQKTCKL